MDIFSGSASWVFSVAYASSRGIRTDSSRFPWFRKCRIYIERELEKRSSAITSIFCWTSLQNFFWLQSSSCPCHAHHRGACHVWSHVSFLGLSGGDSKLVLEEGPTWRLKLENLLQVWVLQVNPVFLNFLYEVLDPRTSWKERRQDYLM